MGDIVYFGSEIKLNIGLEPIGELSMDDYSFECEFFCYSNRRVALTKGEMIRKDKDSYIAVLDSKTLGTGSLKCKITAHILDADCPDGLRTEVLLINTGIQIQGA